MEATQTWSPARPSAEERWRQLIENATPEIARKLRALDSETGLRVRTLLVERGGQALMSKSLADIKIELAQMLFGVDPPAELDVNQRVPRNMLIKLPNGREVGPDDVERGDTIASLLERFPADAEPAKA